METWISPVMSVRQYSRDRDRGPGSIDPTGCRPTSCLLILLKLRFLIIGLPQKLSKIELLLNLAFTIFVT